MYTGARLRKKDISLNGGNNMAVLTITKDNFKTEVVESDKPVLLDFWASWCPPCRRENPNVVKAFNEYKDKNFTIVGISLDKDKSKWLKAITDDNLAWTHLSDLKYWDSEIPALYGVRGIPANVLLDPDGVIVAKNITGEDLHKKLKEVIK